MRLNSVKYIVIHCTDTPAGRDVSAAQVDAWHKERGWEGIGYHYLVRLDGTVEQGRPLTKVGAHVYGYNRVSVGVCYVGGRDRQGRCADTRTPEQVAALRQLVSQLKERFPAAKVVGHRDLCRVKECPCFNVATEL